MSDITDDFTEEEIAIDKISISATDYDIANLIYNKFGIIDENTLRIKLSIDIHNIFIQRSRFWTIKGITNRDLTENQKDEYNARVNNLVKIANKLKMNAYKNTIVKEYNEIVKYYSNH